jgi:uncharacterized membrane protein
LSSFWFLPFLIVTTAIILAVGLVYLDTELDIKSTGFINYFLIGGAESARSILSTIAGAMITVAGTVFSITLVALTLASSQLGPRLLQNFMHDRLNQVVLGNYIATFIFALIILRTLKIGPESFVPNISVLFAIIIAIANIFLLVFFIHHISVSIQADHVIAKINLSLQSNIMNLFPERSGDEKTSLENVDSEKEIKENLKHENKLVSANNGYIQAIDYDSMVKIASDNDLLIEMNYQPGNFMIKGQDLAKIYSKSKVQEGITNKIKRLVISGKKRTSGQDAEFSIHQMVEIAAKALSPGVNDPYTAITCIDNLTATMCYLTNALFPSRYRYDNDKKLRLIIRSTSFSGTMDAAFNQIRQYGSGSPSVLIRLMESFQILYNTANDKNHKKVVKRHADMVLREGEKSMHEKNDLQDLKEIYELIKD